MPKNLFHFLLKEVVSHLPSYSRKLFPFLFKKVKRRKSKTLKKMFPFFLLSSSKLVSFLVEEVKLTRLILSHVSSFYPICSRKHPRYLEVINLSSYLAFSILAQVFHDGHHISILFQHSKRSGSKLLYIRASL